MNTRHVEIAFFVVLLGVTVAFSFLVFLPYVSAVVLAGTLAIVFRPVYRGLLRALRYPSAAAAVTVAVVLIVVFIPLGLFGARIFNETKALYTSITSGGGFDFGAAMTGFMHAHFPTLTVPTFTFNVGDSFSQALTWVIANFAPLFSSIAQVLFIALLSLIGLFYLLKERESAKQWVLGIIPLHPKYTEEIIHETEAVLRSVIEGTLIVAIIQGIAAGIGFFIFKVPDPAFWGALVMLASLIPIVGTWLVMVPAIAYLFFTGQTIPALGLAIWSIILVNLIYNILSPQLMHRGVHIHPYIILLSVLGGIAAFGPIGFLLGPFVIALLLSLVNLYPKVSGKQSQTK